MNKTLLTSLLSISSLFFSSYSLACSGNVTLSVPHIHDENALLVSIQNAKHSELKQLDISQLFDEKVESHQHNLAKNNSGKHVHEHEKKQ